MSEKKLAELVEFVGILSGDTLEVHAGSHDGTYATLCGLDGDDPHPDVRQSVVKLSKREREITCRSCQSIIETAKKYKITWG